MRLLIKNKLNQKKQIIANVVACAFILGLAGCANDDVSDLRQFVQQVKGRPKVAIPPLPEIKIVEPYIFNPSGLRDPFRAIERVEEKTPVKGIVGVGLHPDVSRRKEELEAYSLDTLRMVGTLTMANGLWALIKASDGTIHRVQKGHHMGRNYGEIIRIIDNRIELMEIVPDTPGAWREQLASIALAE